jgi:hypothetical protein
MALVIVLLALGWPLAAWLYWSRRQDRLRHASQAGAWFWQRVELEQRVDDLREMVNRERRNSGKAEV